MNHQQLKDSHRQQRDQMPEGANLRIHRSLSWLQRAEQSGDDFDAQFIFLWIAFNAAYASEFSQQERLDEQSTFRSFIDKLVVLDREGQLEKMLWQQFSGSVRLLLDNQYVFPDFWAHQRGEVSTAEWQRRFNSNKAAASHAMGKRDVGSVLSIVLGRVYTLRNQLMHGGATWNSAVNREQVRDCAQLLNHLVPLVIELMLSTKDTLWGDAVYPVVDG